MDEQTFRRMAPDAVAGRLDAAALERWKAAAAESPARASFVVRVVEADSKVSGICEPVRDVHPIETQRVSKHTFRGLALFFGVFGLFAGALSMHSCMTTQQRLSNNASTIALDNTPANTSPKNTPPENTPAPPANQPASVNSQPTHEAQPEPDPQPQPAPTAGITIATGRVRGRKPGGDWLDLKPGDDIAGYERVAVLDGRFEYVATAILIRISERTEFGWADGALRFYDGRACVVANGVACSAYKSHWQTRNAEFVLRVQKFGGELQLLAGRIELGTDAPRTLAAPRQLALETEADRALSAVEIRALESELLGPHDVLLYWDCESPATAPTMGELTVPGALGDGHAVRRVAGDPGIGVGPGTLCFTAEAGARLRLRVKTDARRIRIEFRVQYKEGYRVVDALIDVSSSDWALIDVPLERLGAGRFRAETGWLPGHEYSGFLVAPAIDLDMPAARHEISLDDLLVYVPR